MTPPFTMLPFNHRKKHLWWPKVQRDLIAMLTLIKARAKAGARDMTALEIEECVHLIVRFGVIKEQLDVAMQSRYAMKRTLVEDVAHLWADINRELQRPRPASHQDDPHEGT